MNVAFLYDPGNTDGTLGGAELTMREFAAAAPDTVDLTGPDDAETVVLGNCVTFGPDLIGALEGKAVVRYHNDLSPHVDPELEQWLDRNAQHVFTSPLHQDRYGLKGNWPHIPPAINLNAYRLNREQRRKTERAGTISVGSWQNEGKGQQLVREWADQNEPVAVYGSGPFVPAGPNIVYGGTLEPDQVPGVMQSAKRFVHLPTAVEPFGRAVVEAWAAGCQIVTNRLVGARHYIENDPQALETAAEDFWRTVS